MNHGILGALVLALVPSCALIDGLGGGDDGAGSDQQFTCEEPREVFVGDIFEVIDVCGQRPRPSDFSCASGGPQGTDVVFRVDVPFPGNYSVCINSADGPIPVIGEIAVTRMCGAFNTLACFSANGCTSVALDEGPNFIHLVLDDVSLCGAIAVGVIEEGIGVGESPNCLDGFDNDGNTLTDCEDPSCWGDDQCEARVSEESCNGVDDGDTPPFPGGTIDELACQCLNDSGCDDLNGDETGSPFICHNTLFDPADGIGVCAPSCKVLDWCIELGGQCLSDGQCCFQNCPTTPPMP